MSIKQIETNQHIKVTTLAVLSCLVSWLAMQIVALSLLLVLIVVMELALSSPV
jgi:hypothetical protein